MQTQNNFGMNNVKVSKFLEKQAWRHFPMKFAQYLWTFTSAKAKKWTNIL